MGLRTDPGSFWSAEDLTRSLSDTASSKKTIGAPGEIRTRTTTFGESRAIQLPYRGAFGFLRKGMGHFIQYLLGLPFIGLYSSIGGLNRQSRQILCSSQHLGQYSSDLPTSSFFSHPSQNCSCMK